MEKKLPVATTSPTSSDLSTAEFPPSPDAASSVSSQQQVLQARRQQYGPNAALNYSQPLHMVRGEGTYLWDAKGRQYLDCVNNVAHLGHCHPGVSAGASESSRHILRAACPAQHQQHMLHSLPRACTCVHAGSSTQDSRGTGCSRYIAGGVNLLWIVEYHHALLLPQVTAAVCQQLGTLNTNSRYLSEALTGYTEQLLATFPEQLEVAYLVNSGSEANDLALRICRWAQQAVLQPALRQRCPCAGTWSCTAWLAQAAATCMLHAHANPSHVYGLCSSRQSSPCGNLCRCTQATRTSGNQPLQLHLARCPAQHTGPPQAAASLPPLPRHASGPAGQTPHTRQ